MAELGSSEVQSRSALKPCATGRLDGPDPIANILQDSQDPTSWNVVKTSRNYEASHVVVPWSTLEAEGLHP